MKIILGFASIQSLQSSVSGVTAQFGELSDYSRTFSTSRSEFFDPVSYPGVELDAFSTVTDSGSPITPSSATQSHILSVISWVLARHNDNSIPSNVSKASFLTMLAAASVTPYPDPSHHITAGGSGWEVNQIVNGTPSTSRMPDYVKWNFDDSGDEYQIQIWFIDESFKAQYPNYSIVLVPPMTDINMLDNPAATVSVALATFHPSDLATAIQAAIGTNPATTVTSVNVTYNDPTVSPPAVPGTINTTWVAIVHGQEGINSDNIKDAIRGYIAAHTTTRSGGAPRPWSTIYPGLYSENEFIIIPMWNDVAIPPSGLDPQVYSSAIKTGKLATVATELLPSSYAASTVLASFLQNNLELMSVIYSAMQALVVGNPNNAEGLYALTQVYADYTDIITTSGDFARMGVATQAFATKLADALDKASTLTIASTVPAGYTRVVRDDRVYLSFTMPSFTVGSLTVPDMNYLVLSKGSYVVT